MPDRIIRDGRVCGERLGTDCTRCDKPATRAFVIPGEAQMRIFRCDAHGPHTKIGFTEERLAEVGRG